MPFRIGVVTGSAHPSEDALRGVDMLVKAYGSANDGGMIRHVTYPDDFMSQQEACISSMVSLSDDPLVKAVIVNQAIPGTAEAFRRIKAKRPDILTLAAEAHEDARLIAGTADLVVGQDVVARGYQLIWAAKQMDAKTFVHISFTRHMSMESIRRRSTVMEAACKDLGIRWAFETAPDPLSSEGLAAAQPYIQERVPVWLRHYGPQGERVAMFSTSSAHAEPLARELLASRNGFVPEMDLPTPTAVYSGAIALDLTAEQGNIPAILEKVEAAIAKEAPHRFAAWASSYGSAVTAGLGEYAIRVLEHKARKNNLEDLAAAVTKWTPGMTWRGTRYAEPSGHVVRNHILIATDTETTRRIDVPRKYYTLK